MCAHPNPTSKCYEATAFLSPEERGELLADLVDRPGLRIPARQIDAGTGCLQDVRDDLAARYRSAQRASRCADYRNPEIASLIERTQQSSAASAVDKVKFYKLAWDAVGSEFASRHQHYEMFFTGASFVIKGRAFRFYDWDAAGTLVNEILNGYDLADELGDS
ncbi:MAG: 4-hydroxyphenylacetate 3-hydroxylase C-terminal domain-containing protein [Sphingorhabdus sp.]